ncbi:Protein SCO2, mitochondrial [Thelohanellus kitauei]|uniref:Protein SCO2, mitochondrial n=1 Tax=Thelohanellus kitauei TaxID=669202 RepID=A0A0C2N8W0_THEKT|nr:Protein SCO2, mitochondrial [Thelohanellus kitauei]
MIRAAILSSNKVSRLFILWFPVIGASRTFFVSRPRHDDSEPRVVIRYKTFKNITLGCLVALGCLYSYVIVKGYFDENRAIRVHNNIYFLELGGPFELIDHNRNRFTEKNLESKFCLFYFGFCSRPDVCSAPLQKVTEIINHLPSNYSSRYLKGVFVSIDPERDTPELVKDYIKNFHPNIVGLIGDKKQIDHVRKAFGVNHKIPVDVKPDDEFVGYTDSIFLVGPDGLVRTIFSKDKNIDEITDQIKSMVSDCLKEQTKAINYRLN